MADAIKFKSPIRTTDRVSGALTLVDQTASARILVRGADSGLTAQFGHTERRPDGVLVCGSRPDEWVLIGELADAVSIAASVQADGFVSVVDQTHSRAMIRLTGIDAANALAKLCSADFGDHMTPDGAVLSASVAKVTCDIVRDDQDGLRSYLIMVDRSFGAYMFDVLADAAAEFGIHRPSR